MEISFFDSVQRAKKEYARVLEPVCRQWMLTRNEVDILLFLYNNPEMDRASDIVNHRGISKSHVSLSVGTLEEKVLLLRCADKTDRRSSRLALTAQGRVIAEQARTAQYRFFERLFNGVTPEELAIWKEISKKVEHNIKNMEEL